MDGQSFIVECRSQGIAKQALNREELAAWFKEEEQFWNGISAIDQNYTSLNQNFGQPGILNTYQTNLRGVTRALEQGSYEAATAYLDHANGLKLILGHGRLGNQVKELVTQRQIAAAQRLVFLFSEGILNPRDEIKADLVLLKIATFFNPFQVTTADIVSAQDAKDSAQETAAKMEEARANYVALFEQTENEFSEYVKGKTAELVDLHQMYESYLLLQGPSRHWKRVSQTAMRFSIGALVVFVAMLALPTWIICANWSGISGYIDHVLDVTKGTISLASIVVFTVPVLAYGWLLKHISRIFTQNLMISADAEHRRVMAVTFLGLARRKSVGISEQDRALILNALFRPSPTSQQDDGPPSGLLELIKK